MAGAYIQQADASTADRLFVTRIPQHATREEVAAYFSRFGLTTDVYLPQAPGMAGHKGIAFVSFSDPGAVQLCITNGPHVIADHEVVVDIAAPRGAQPHSQAPQLQPQPAMVQQVPEQASADRLFVTKVPPELQREHLREYFAAFGDLTDVYMPSAPGSGAHKGICFVSFSDPSALQFALQHTPHEVRGYPVVVDVAAPRGAASADRLFVTKVPPALQQEHLREHFAQFGDLTDVYMPSVPGGGGHKGICFVSFSDPNALQFALQHPAHEVRGYPVVVDAAAPRGKVGPGAGAGAGAPRPQPSARVSATPAPPQVATGFSGAMGANTALGGFGGFAAGGFGAAAPAPAPSQSRGTPVPGRLFVTRVTPDMSKVDLQLYFEQFGELEDVFIPMGGKGIAFVSYRDSLVSQRVLQSQQHFVKPGKAVVVDQARDRPPLGGKGGGNAPAGFGITRTSVVGQAAQPTRFSPY